VRDDLTRRRAPTQLHLVGDGNVVAFPQRVAQPDLSALIAEGMTAAEIAGFIAFTNADLKTQARRLAQLKEPEEAKQFTYRLWLVRRVLAQIDWSKAVIRNDASSDKPPKDFATWPQAKRNDWMAERAKEWRQEQAAKKDREEEDDEEEEGKPAPGGPQTTSPLPLSDFVAFSPDHSYIYRPDGADWSATAVNARVPPVKRGPDKRGRPRKPISASTWLDRNDAVVQRTWCPGEPQIIEDKLFDQGGVIRKAGARVFNLYRPPAIIRVTDDDVSFWQSHLYELWPDEAEHIEKYFAHRAQRPGEKVNHGLLLCGAQGIGKDAMIEPLRRAVGAWNVKEVSPQAILGNFNEFVQSVVLRISEIKDLGDIDRFAFYEACKTLMAAPPDTLRCNPKFVKPFHILNVTSPIMTSNYKVSGLYLPADDRRHFVAWSNKIEADYSAAYWVKYWQRLEDGGAEAVAAHLRALDLKDFNPKAPPRKTQAFWEIVDSLRTAEGSDMADMIEALGNPPILTSWFLIEEAKRANLHKFAEWLEDPKNRRKTSIELEENGYQRLDNRHDKRGRWSFATGWDFGRWRLPSGWRGNVYRRKDLSDRDGFEGVRRAGGEA
jgi:hypothetical protein